MLVPRPRINLLLYYGVLGARAGRRTEIVNRPRADALAGAAHGVEGEGLAVGAGQEGTDGGRGRQWAALMQRTFGFDVLACPRCGGRLRLIALIEEAEVVRRILRHLGLPDEIPRTRPARAPPATARLPRPACLAISRFLDVHE